MTKMPDRLRGLGATGLLVMLTLGTPMVLLSIGATPWTTDTSGLGSVLTSPDDGTLALAAFGLVAWLSWAVVVVTVVTELWARVTRISTPHLPALHGAQRLTARLVGAATLLFVVAPSVAQIVAPPAASAVVAPPSQESPALQPVVTDAHADSVTEPEEPSTVDYTVRRGDSLWRIAERLLGDGARYPEIVDLNAETLDGRPDFIASGTVLRVPLAAPAADAGSRSHVVKPGETLSEIAAEHLGDPARYPEIVEASRSTIQPDGLRLTDPDHIEPGWRLTIPDQATAAAKPQPADEPTTSPRTPAQSRDMHEMPADIPTATASEAAGDPSDDAEQPHGEAPSVEAWAVPGLVGAGSLLAGALVMSLRAGRRIRLRHRTPGRVISRPPLALRNVEKTTMMTATHAATRIGALDDLLRSLTGSDQPPPLRAVQLSVDTATLHLAAPEHLGSPWSGDGTTWSASLDAPRSDGGRPAPYPTLVSLGQDERGDLWLVDLEALGHTSIAGDEDRAEALVRHICAELALSPWSVDVRTDTIGIGVELSHLDPIRLTHHNTDDIDFLDQVLADTHRAQQTPDDPEPFRAVVIAGSVRSPVLDELVSRVEESAVRVGTAVISASSEDRPPTIAIDGSGHLDIPGLGLRIEAAGLTAEEAKACAAIVEFTSTAETMAPAADEANPRQAFVTTAGSLRPELTEKRPEGPAGPSSLLPEPAATYADHAATTVDDIDELAPIVPAETRAAVEESDPTLDDNIAEWFDPECRLPKLILLGPVAAKAHGEYRQIAERKAYFVEMLAYLALHPKGVPAAAVAEAFSISASRARTDVGFIRSWLADEPQTGRPHLPAANASKAFKETGLSLYQLERVLTDVDLFRRLRTRGQARGEAGMADLVTALRLVQGEPFSLLRERGWSWLLDGERLHETITFAIVDTAHVVVTDALERGDLERAQKAADTSCRAAPYDEIARLDRIAVAEAGGHHELAERLTREDIIDRTDDDLPPIDLPERTKTILSRAAARKARSER